MPYTDRCNMSCSVAGDRHQGRATQPGLAAVEKGAMQGGNEACDNAEAEPTCMLPASWQAAHTDLGPPAQQCSSIGRDLHAGHQLAACTALAGCLQR